MLCHAQGVNSLTFEEDNLVVTGTLVHGVHAVQVQRQAPPEAMHLSRLQGHQVSVPGQSPEILAWVRKGKMVTIACCGYRDPFYSSMGPQRLTFEEECFSTDLGHSVKVGGTPVRHILLGPAGQNVRRAEREDTQPKQLGELFLPESRGEHLGRTHNSPVSTR